MKNKTKSTLILIGVLLIGVIIGAVGSSLIRQKIWEDRVARFRSPHGFSDRLMELIQPDPQQEKAVKEILLKHHEKMRARSEKSRMMLRTHADSLIIELESVLRPEQLERAKKILKRRPSRFGPRDEPPPFGPRGGEPPPFDPGREREERKEE